MLNAAARRRQGVRSSIGRFRSEGWAGVPRWVGLLTRLVLLSIHSSALAWIANLDGAPPGASDAAVAVAVDRAGDVVAAGHTGASEVEAFTVVKRRGTDGSVVWRRVVTGTGDGSGRALAVAVDGADAVITAGVLDGKGTADDFAVVKWDAAGNEQWRRVIDGTANYFDEASTVTVDRAGDVIATGFLVNQTTSYDFFVVKWNAAGAEQWRRTVRGNAIDGFDLGTAVAVDSEGSVVAAGTTDLGEQLTVVKWNAAGTEQWRRTARGTDPIAIQEAAAVATDSSGAVVVAGALNNSTTGFDLFVIKWTRLGVEQWRRTVNGTAVDSSDFASALVIDSKNAVVVAGTTDNTAGSAWTIVKWDAVGSEKWRKVLADSPSFSGRPAGLATDADDAVVAVGSAYSAASEDSDGALFKWASDGSELWRRFIDGTLEVESVQSEAADGLAAVALDAAGHVAAAGITLNDG